MAAIASLSDFVNRSTGGNSGTPEHKPWTKVARIAAAAAPATIAGKTHSLWLYAGSPSAGVAATTVAVPTRATAGALKQANPGGARTKYLTGWGASPEVGGALLLYDRLLHIGGLSGTSVAAQTVGGALNRYTSTTESIGNMIMVEINTAIGTTATTITASYTKEDGVTSGRTTTAIAFGGTGNLEKTRAFILPLQAGDEGVTAVASITLAASTVSAAGDIGVSIIKPLARLSVGYAPIGDDFAALAKGKGPIEVKTDACLAFLWAAFNTTAPNIHFGDAHFIEA